jgi:hypothetical protein
MIEDQDNFGTGASSRRPSCHQRRMIVTTDSRSIQWTHEQNDHTRSEPSAGCDLDPVGGGESGWRRL